MKGGTQSRFAISLMLLVVDGGGSVWSGMPAGQGSPKNDVMGHLASFT